MEPIAIRNELELNDVKVLWGLKHCNISNTFSDLADTIGMSRALHSSILQKLVQKKLIKIDIERNPRQISILFLEEAGSILDELEQAEKNYKQLQFTNFTKEELLLYNELSQKIKTNIQTIL